MKTKLFPVGTFVVAIKDIGPVRDGQPGIVTGVVEQGFAFWKRQIYLCTFFGNVMAAMKPNEVSDFDHGYSREQLEEPKDGNLSVAELMKRIRPLR